MNSLQGLPNWIKNPIYISDDLTENIDSCINNPLLNLSNHIITKLSLLKISHLFPVQTALLPLLQNTKYSSARRSPRDICVAAPTGSGKTLSYVIPIVDFLLPRIIPRIRALIVLPTRDLAIQVKATIDSLISGTDLKIALLTGQSNANNSYLQKFSNGIDIVIATPGKLIEHLQNSPEFTLEHLRFLVIDEADRLLGQQYQDWISLVLSSAETPISKQPTLEYDSAGLLKPFTQHTIRYQEFDDTNSIILKSFTPIQKLLFSATFTHDPSKLAILKLHNPTLICIKPSTKVTPNTSLKEDIQYVIPSTLTEFRITCTSTLDKPMCLYYLLFIQKLKGVLVFTQSIETTQRLTFIMNSCAEKISKMYSDSTDKVNIKSFNSTQTTKQKKKLITDFKTSKIDVLICTDLMARGMDLGESVNVVINYDIAPLVKNYIHRIGRCARAGRSGVAYTILEVQQVRWFKHSSADVQRTHKVKNMDVKEELIDTRVYQRALDQLQDLVQETKKDPSKRKLQNDSDSEPASDSDSSCTSSSSSCSSESLISDNFTNEKQTLDHVMTDVVHSEKAQLPKETGLWGAGWI